MLRHFARTLLLDAAVIAGGVIAIALTFHSLVGALEMRVGIGHAVARVIVVVMASALLLPFCVSVLRTTQRFARLLGELAVPRNAAAVDLGNQPRIAIGRR